MTKPACTHIPELPLHSTAWHPCACRVSPPNPALAPCTKPKAYLRIIKSPSSKRCAHLDDRKKDKNPVQLTQLVALKSSKYPTDNHNLLVRSRASIGWGMAVPECLNVMRVRDWVWVMKCEGRSYGALEGGAGVVQNRICLMAFGWMDGWR